MIDARALGRQPAYPMTYADNGCDLVVYHPGVTLRQPSEVLAMQGLVSNPHESHVLQASSQIAQWSAQLADALLDELAKVQP